MLYIYIKSEPKRFFVSDLCKVVSVIVQKEEEEEEEEKCIFVAIDKQTKDQMNEL